MTVARKAKRKKNPVPASVRVQLRDGIKLYKDFSGEKEEIFSISKPKMPDVLLLVGDCDGIMYTTIRDGKVEKYLHQFEKKSRPLLCASSDGKMLFLLGGAYDFTERGIVDARKK